MPAKTASRLRTFVCHVSSGILIPSQQEPPMTKDEVATALDEIGDITCPEGRECLPV